MTCMILVVAEQQDGVLNRASWEAIAAAQADGRTGQGRRAWARASARVAARARGGRRRRGHRARARRAWRRTPPTASSRRSPRSFGASRRAHVVFPHTYQTRDFAPALAARLDRALVTDCIGRQAAADARAVHAADVPGQGPRRRRARRAGAASRDVPGRRVPRRRGARRARGPRRSATRRGRRSTRRRSARSPRRRSARPKQAVDLVAGRAHRRGRPRHQGPGAHRARSSDWPRRSAPSSPRRGRSATPAGCRWSARSAARARPWRRSCTSRSASPARSSTSSA